MNQNPTIPPIPKRPPPKPNRIPPVSEKIVTTPHIVDPYRGIGRVHHNPAPIRPALSSETDLEVVRHGVEIKSLERRTDDLEDLTSSLDTKMDVLSDTVKQDIAERKLEKAIKEDEKVKEDQKTKRFQALLIAIPLILSTILGFLGSYMAKPAPDYRTNTVVVAEYTQRVADCKKNEKELSAYELCVRKAQLDNTPKFEH